MKRGRLFLTYQILGVDGFSLIERLHSAKIPIYRLSGEKGKTIFSIDYCDRKKLFAISNNMCYNITKVKYYGKVSPFKKIAENLGFALSFVCFLVLCFLFDGYVGKITYLGDGEYLRPQIEKVLESEGVKENSFFKADEKLLSKKIIASNEKISFVSVKKTGRILYIEVYKAEESAKPIDVKKEKIISTVSGAVKSINLLSGTAKVSVGDVISVGDILIDGTYEKDGKVLTTYALGEVEIITKTIYDYKSFAKGEKYKNRAVAVAMLSLGDVEIEKSEVKEKTVGNEFFYEVTLYYGVTVG